MAYMRKILCPKDIRSVPSMQDIIITKLNTDCNSTMKIKLSVVVVVPIIHAWHSWKVDMECLAFENMGLPLTDTCHKLIMILQIRHMTSEQLATHDWVHISLDQMSCSTWYLMSIVLFFCRNYANLRNWWRTEWAVMTLSKVNLAIRGLCPHAQVWHVTWGSGNEWVSILISIDFD